MSVVKTAKYFFSLHQVLKDTNTILKPTCIWNMDESDLQMDFKPTRILATKGTKHLQSRTSGKRETITIIAAVNAAGGSIPPHLIPKGKTVRALQTFNTDDAPTGTNWSVSESGWTKQGIGFLWFTKPFLPNIGPERPQDLIVDGHDSHNSIELLTCAVENQIEIEEMPAHCSHWLQPLDRTVFRPLKNFYNQTCQELMSNFPGITVDKSNFCGLFAKAWKSAVTADNIISVFRACPFNPSAIPSEAYLPNSIYSVDQLLENQELLDSSLQSAVETLESVPDVEIEKQNLIAEELINVTNAPVVNLPVPVEQPSSETQPVVDLQDLDMSTQWYILETNLTAGQHTTFQYCFDNNFDIPDPLRTVAPFLAKLLSVVYNLSLNRTFVPKQWKSSIITPVAKTSKPAQCADFRPISVTPLLSRLMEKIVISNFLYTALINPKSFLFNLT